MTREELIHHIRYALDIGADITLTNEEGKEVIKALEQEPILDKIYADIQKLRNCSCSCSDGIIDDIEDILDKYKAESEDKECTKRR